MKSYKSMTKEELNSLHEELLKAYEDTKGRGLKLNMARGKPSSEQLDLSMGMLDLFSSKLNPFASGDVDTRNYGELTGILEAKHLMADLVGADADNTIVFGNASLPVMYDTVSRSVTHGVCGSTPWCKLDKVKFLCPVPGYDRHFAITEHFGIEMIPIPMNNEGPDMDMVKDMVETDATVKGIWCVPKYSNPSGITYSDRVVRAFAALNPAAKDFRIYWDNAYSVHNLYEDREDTLLNIFDECKAAGHEDMVFVFASTSKITFAGAGLGAMAASENNMAWVKKSMTIQTIGYDKMNMLRHTFFFKDFDGIRAHMKKHADILRPKFEAVLKELDKELGGHDIATWTRPNGGYFISLDCMEGTASKIVAKCKEAGMVLTGAGATYPYGNDPHDSNIRIAPSFPSLDEIEKAAELLVLCVKLVTVEKLMMEV